MKRVTRIIVAALIVTVGMTFSAGDAFAVSKPGKVNLTGAKRNGTQVTLTWKKVRGANGYRLYRKTVGKTGYKKVKDYSSKTLKVTNTGLVAGNTYRYIMRSYKTYKVKQWYNKKTKKWQTSKPKKRYRGSKRYVTKRIYSNLSNVRQVVVPAKKLPAPTGLKAGWDQYSNGTTDYWGLDFSWNKVKGAVKYNVYRDGKKVKTTKANYLWEQRVSGKVRHKLQVTAVNKTGVESARATITAPYVPGYKPPTKTTTKSTTKSTTKATTKATTKPQTTYDYKFPVKKNISMNYNGTKIYLGQTWSSTLFNNLKSGASGSETVVRKGTFCRYYEHPEYGNVVHEKYMDETVHMIDTGDYDQFIAIYVVNGQVIEWLTNCQDMGTNGSTRLSRGSKSFPAYGTGYIFRSSEGCKIGGFASEDSNTLYFEGAYPAVEKRVGFHFINATRKVYGVKTLQYEPVFDGEQNVINGEYQRYGNTYTYNNRRYGAQAWAETMAQSDTLSHDTLSRGPLAGLSYGQRGVDIRAASGDTLSRGSENCGCTFEPCGEVCVGVYVGSEGHLGNLLNPSFRKVGIGFCGKYHCEVYGN